MLKKLNQVIIYFFLLPEDTKPPRCHKGFVFLSGLSGFAAIRYRQN